MRRIPPILALLLLASPDARAWDGSEHMNLCSTIRVPPGVGGVTAGGWTVFEWCAMPDYGHNMADVVTVGPCSDPYSWHWEWAQAVIDGCGEIWARNNNHFGGFAYTSWHHYHEMAKAVAQKYATNCTPGCDRAALAIEGWALHYLTDAFAAGHAWNPLGDYESPEGNYWMYYSGSEVYPDVLFPPPGDVNVFRQGFHDTANALSPTLAASGLAPLYFADARFGQPAGTGVIGDHLLAFPSLQQSWTLDRAAASMLDTYWTMIGVNGVGGCVLTNVCSPDSAGGFLDQGDGYECIPFLSNQSWLDVMSELNWNSASQTYYGGCDPFTNPAGHDCAFEGPDRPIPFWPGSLHYDADQVEPAGVLGCDLSDPAIYDDGNCATADWNRDQVLARQCNAVPAGTCDFRTGCEMPELVEPEAPDAGVPATTDGGTLAADAARPDGPPGNGGGGGDDGDDGCAIAGGARGAFPAALLVAVIALALAVTRRRRRR